MPENDDPRWPSDDKDTSSTEPKGAEGNGESTVWLPMSGQASGKTEELSVPKVTPESGGWFQPVVEVEDEPDVPETPTPRWSAFAPVTPVEPKEPEEPKTLFVKPVQQQRQDEPDWDQFDRSTRTPSRDPEPRPESRQEPQRQEPRLEEPPAPSPREPERRPEQNRVEPPRPAPVPSASMHARPVRIEPAEERLDAEATVGMRQPEPPSEKPPAAETDTEAAPPPKPKKRKRKVLVITTVVVVLLLAGLGGAAAMPKVSNRLGLPWAPNAPKGDIPKPAGVTRVLHGPDVNGSGPTKEGLAAALKGPAGSADLGTLTGTVVDAATGDVLWDKNSATPLTPASTTKLLVVAAALLSLDHGMQISTKIVQGADPSTVILVAGGDPTLTSLPLGTDSPLYPGAAHVDDLVAQVKKASGGKISKVQLDASLFKGPTAAVGWDPEDTAAGNTYMAPVVPVMADGGRTDPKNDHSSRVANPAMALTQKIAGKLEAQAGGTATAPKDAKVLGEVKSQPLTEFANSLLQLSDNMLGDALARQIALAKGGEPSFAGGATATMEVLKQAGFDLTGVQLNDGSGLSDQNKIPAKVLSEILAVAAAPDGQDPRTAKLRPMLAGLPVAGGSGTLEKRYSDPASSAGRGWVRGKTGTLSGVNTLAGVVLDTDGRMLVFALMSSGSDQNKGRAALDVVAATLHKCGCR
ncbi:D-alanyl-D-alanine carboxypeptidase/D-alanyl-D-alanine endopeptidase [Amycolatopsis regifaucium]|uniref:D-alanyl-D-alanine carboxypeptidase n=1 Tax=Amycolatopsis regifaucium TaxID=546365 RepID=A0A154MFR7_9PSEU|nr:D-alanyl-D-alanine carboxypeptidase/D-alanyl-D-alanine-endopeptidase [Amycolatopsis regifaucium]KZB83331.1 D-alanyl-D-alanine carboxypeptidase [Amycolatopsis regifaucium]OKA08797.1 D-alanyl-D-alanine carboxypeptidase/D-alanyl-D-alanine-endopeptidase [Amycolatopsis regifaucium]SFI94504.1 D-alanyl-D-alanine carboxypeptidase / D-alanyl-D-alanine-endopeptidase (penicillin-binding protein 4) [Amycolatopsis regifaucium]